MLEELAAFVDANEADPIAYNIYLDEGCTQMTVVQIHPSSASMELHMKCDFPEVRGVTGALAR